MNQSEMKVNDQPNDGGHKMVEQKNCHSNCHGYALIFLVNLVPHIAKSGPNKASELKTLFGIAEKNTLVGVFEDDHRKEYKDDDIVHIKGCEVFMSKPPCASNSGEDIAKELAKFPFKSVFGCDPTLVKEAGADHLIFSEVPIGADGKKVKMLLEWPHQKRLFFSEQIPTPKNDKPNWGYPGVRLCGSTWQGISLATDEANPYDALLSMMGKLVW